jgi:hypothetical protein
MVHVRLKKLYIFEKFESELPNIRYFYADGFTVGTGCCADGQSVPTITGFVPRLHCADGEVPTAILAVLMRCSGDNNATLTD